MGRGQLWFAYGELEIIRQNCVNLARLRYDFSDAHVGVEPYFKVDEVLPVQQLLPLEATCCPLEYDAMLQAARDIFRFYQAVAPALARVHGIPYQVRTGTNDDKPFKRIGFCQTGQSCVNGILSHNPHHQQLIDHLTVNVDCLRLYPIHRKPAAGIAANRPDIIRSHP